MKQQKTNMHLISHEFGGADTEVPKIECTRISKSPVPTVDIKKYSGEELEQAKTGEKPL